jgi:exopolyphosphatase/guanosine-5'-triphosphate,3'-diphosphate pyrophosphatase
MTIASIDIGTNTILLLVAEVNPVGKTVIPVYEEQKIPRLGEKLKPGGRIANEKVDLLIQILSGYEQTIRSHNAEKIFLTGTNALRIASNSAEISKLIKRRFNLDLNVISGDEEAEFAYLGAISGINNFDNALVIDIGGGSTELISGDQEKILFKRSFPIGSVSATELFFHHTPPDKIELTNIRNELNKLFDEIRNKFSTGLIIGIAGTATTLTCMIKGMEHFDSKTIDGSVISRKELDDLIEMISSLKPAEILNKYGEVVKGREDIITSGAIIMSELISMVNANEIAISSRGIRYGAAISALFMKS